LVFTDDEGANQAPITMLRSLAELERRDAGSQALPHGSVGLTAAAGEIDQRHNADAGPRAGAIHGRGMPP
jgi:hypothetical protein